MKIGVVGYKGHARRLIDIVKDNEIITFHPYKKDVRIITNNLNDLLNTDCIFIASPNDTHFGYITQLKCVNNYSGKIFCEKPPVADLESLESLNKLEEELYQDVYFNFNFRKTMLHDHIKDKLEQLGRTLNVKLSLTHGLAYKKNYIDSWRSKDINNNLGVIETVGIHWINLFISLFGEIKDYKMFNNVIANTGNTYDNSNLISSHSDGTISEIFVSYASCKHFSLILHCTNGTLEFKNDQMVLTGPRDVFDSNGNFKYPRQTKTSYSFDDDYHYSLKSSVEYFLKHVQEKKSFEKKNWQDSLESNRTLLKLKNNFQRCYN